MKIKMEWFNMGESLPKLCRYITAAVLSEQGRDPFLAWGRKLSKKEKENILQVLKDMKDKSEFGGL